MRLGKWYLGSLTALLLIILMAWFSLTESEPEPTPDPKPITETQTPPQENKQQPTKPTAQPANQGGGWIDYTPKYLWAYSSQFHEGFQNITDAAQIEQAVRLINSAPLVTSAPKQENWGLLLFITGEMQLHYSQEERVVYLFFGGQIRKADEKLLEVLQIEPLRAL